MRVLSIETSCDETSIAILEASGGITNASFKVLAHIVSSQVDVHMPYGGVFPALAKREHIKNLPILLDQALKKARLDKKKKPLDLIAVTSGPGLEPALWTGIVFAQGLAEKWQVPLVPVNHMEGHLFSVFGKNKGSFKIPKIKTPLLALLVSGGHTQLVLSKKWMRYEIIGETLDDAVGEAFDKVARMLGLPYPGGPQVSRLAEKERGALEKIPQARSLGLSRLPALTAKRRGQSEDFAGKSLRSLKEHSVLTLPRPLLKSKDFNFSYSGLKTAVLYKIRDLRKLTPELISRLSLEFENAAIEPLVYKTQKAIEKYKVKTLVVGGGVSANRHLRNEIEKAITNKTTLYFPPKELTGDNGLMIGIAGYLEYLKNKKKVPDPKTIAANGNLSL